MSYQLTSAVTKEDNIYVARCIELGTVSQGKSIEKALENLKEATEFYLEDFPLQKRVKSSFLSIASFNVNI